MFSIPENLAVQLYVLGTNLGTEPSAKFSITAVLNLVSAPWAKFSITAGSI
eukprot:SAG31_NODE_23744_length_497_cov_0.902010_2_plen_51_part_00